MAGRYTVVYELPEVGGGNPYCKRRRVQVIAGKPGSDSRHQVLVHVDGDFRMPTFWKTVPKGGDPPELREAIERANQAAEARARSSWAQTPTQTQSERHSVLRSAEQKLRRNTLDRLRRESKRSELRKFKFAERERLEAAARSKIQAELDRARLGVVNGLHLGLRDVRDWGASDLTELATRIGSRNAAERLAARACEAADEGACEGILKFWLAGRRLGMRGLRDEITQAAAEAFPREVQTTLTPDGFFVLDLDASLRRQVWRRFGGHAGTWFESVRVGELVEVEPQEGASAFLSCYPGWWTFPKVFAIRLKKVVDLVRTPEQRRALRRVARLVTKLFDQGGGGRVRQKREQLMAQSKAEVLLAVTSKIERQLELIAMLVELLPKVFHGGGWRISLKNGVEVKKTASSSDRAASPLVGLGDFGFGFDAGDSLGSDEGGEEEVWVAWGNPQRHLDPKGRVFVDISTHETQGGVEVARSDAIALCRRCEELSKELFKLLNPLASGPDFSSRPVRPVEEGDQPGHDAAVKTLKGASKELGELRAAAFLAAHPRAQARYRGDLDFMLGPAPPPEAGIPPNTPTPPTPTGAATAAVDGPACGGN